MSNLHNVLDTTLLRIQLYKLMYSTQLPKCVSRNPVSAAAMSDVATLRDDDQFMFS
jgi:hypothetical protein